MKFCEECKGLLIPREGKLGCTNCETVHEGELTFAEKYDNSKAPGIEIVSQINPIANYGNICKKCGYDKAEVILKDPIISDEDSIVMLKCGKCGKVENLTRKMT